MDSVVDGNIAPTVNNSPSSRRRTHYARTFETCSSNWKRGETNTPTRPSSFLGIVLHCKAISAAAAAAAVRREEHSSQERISHRCLATERPGAVLIVGGMDPEGVPNGEGMGDSDSGRFRFLQNCKERGDRKKGGGVIVLHKSCIRQ